MNYRVLGRTGLLVSELSFGTQTFAGKGTWSVFGRQTQDEADRLVGRAIDAGVNLFDTAEVYSEGEAERLLGKALRGRRSSVVVATKVTGRFGAGLNEIGLTRRRIVAAVEASLSRLGTDWIDLFQIHSPDELTPVEETLRALDDVVRAGKVRYVGCSNVYAWQLMKALYFSERMGAARFESVQAYYSIAGRDVEDEMIPCLLDQQVALLVWSPLAGGLLTGKFARGGRADGRRSTFDFPPVDADLAARCIDEMARVASEHGVSIARVALAWLLRRPGVTSVILGATTEEQLEDDLGASQLQLTDHDARRLDQAGAPTSRYPGWLLEVARQGAYDPRTPK